MLRGVALGVAALAALAHGQLRGAPQSHWPTDLSNGFTCRDGTKTIPSHMLNGARAWHSGSASALRAHACASALPPARHALARPDTLPPL